MQNNTIIFNDSSFQKPYLNAQLSAIEGKVMHLTNFDTSFCRPSKRAKREEKEKTGKIVNNIYVCEKMFNQSIEQEKILSKNAIFDLFIDKNFKIVKKVNEDSEMAALYDSIIKKKIDQAKEKNLTILQRKNLIPKLVKIFREALIVKTALSSHLSETQPLLHLGKKFSKLTASFSVLEGINKSPLTLIKIDFLGKGTCKKGTWQLIFETGQSIAQLKTKLSDPNPQKAKKNTRLAQEEAQILQQVNGLPNVVKTYGISYCSSLKGNNEISLHQILLMELFPEGTLYQLVQKNSLDDKQKYHIAQGLLRGLAAIHKVGIVHCDLSLSNLLVKKDPDNPNYYYAAITDFGLAFTENDLRDAVTTYWYMAPELWGDKKKATSKLDVWSMGCSLWKLMNYPKNLPWIEKFPDPKEDSIEAYKKSEGFKILMDPKTFPEPNDQNTLAWIIWKMLRIDPEQRFSAEEALNALEKIDRKSL